MIAQQIIKSTFNIPNKANNVTSILIKETRKVVVLVTNRDITFTTTKEDFQFFWKQIQEGIVSSYLGIHYRHYKAAAHSYKIANFLSKNITVVLKTECLLERRRKPNLSIESH